MRRVGRTSLCPIFNRYLYIPNNIAPFLECQVSSWIFLFCFESCELFVFELKREKIWLWWDLNLRPWAYESPALTTELQSHHIILYNIFYKKLRTSFKIIYNHNDINTY
jgi:hypothetical protein